MKKKKNWPMPKTTDRISKSLSQQNLRGPSPFSFQALTVWEGMCSEDISTKDESVF